jgi:hypothetical protein
MINLKAFMSVIFLPVQTALRQVSFSTQRSPWISFGILIIILEMFSFPGAVVYYAIESQSPTQEWVSFISVGAIFAALCAWYYWKYVLSLGAMPLLLILHPRGLEFLASGE